MKTKIKQKIEKKEERLNCLTEKIESLIAEFNEEEKVMVFFHKNAPKGWFKLSMTINLDTL